MLVPPPDPRLQKFIACAPPFGTGIVYVIVNKVNGKLYVGITRMSARRRFSGHCGKTSKCSAISRAIAKYGRDAFEVHVLDWVDIKYIQEAEIHLIKMNNSMAPSGYNLDEGGGGIYTTDAERERRSDRAKQQIANESPEQKAERLRKQKETKSLPEFKARASVNGKRAIQCRLDDPDFERKRDDRRRQKLADWRKAALPIPTQPKDRVVGQKYIDADGVLFVAQACNNPSPMLRRLGMDQFERDRLRFAK